MENLNLAAWAQAVAIVVTGGLAALVAYLQLRRFNNNERVKTTLDYLSRYHGEKVFFYLSAGNTESATAANALPFLLQPKIQSILLERVPSASTSDADSRQRYLTYLVILSNYFASATSLLRRHLFDEDLFLEHLLPQILDYGTIRSALSTLPELGNTEYDWLVSRALKYNLHQSRGSARTRLGR